MDIVEIDAIKALSDADQIVVACGGGGIPVLMQDNNLKGASAVIEKDLAAGKLAELLDADMLVILTSVDNVCLNYGQPDEKPLSTMTVAEAKKYMEQGQFGEGDMLPKIEAAINFIGDSCDQICSDHKIEQRRFKYPWRYGYHDHKIMFLT